MLLLNCTPRPGWHTHPVLKSNRNQNGPPVTQDTLARRRQRHEKVSVSAIDDTSTLYFTRRLTARLNALAFEL
jgi:hypothetical protein